MAAIRFLNTVAAGVHHKLFRSEGVLREVLPAVTAPVPLHDGLADQTRVHAHASYTVILLLAL